MFCMRQVVACCTALIFLIPLIGAEAQQEPYLNPRLPVAERAHDLVSRMTLDEKASQLEYQSPAIPRLKIPEYGTWNEALHGVAYAGYATVFPQAIGMAATWDLAIVHEEGTVISAEGRAKFNQAQAEGNHRVFYGLTFWSPNINIFRDPRWGRGQETFGEDPFLTSRLGVAFVEGVQGDDPNHPRAVATSKHFAVHSGPEKLRHGFNVDPSPRDLEETYLPAFRATVTEGHVDSVMCAYNAVDNWPSCTNALLLKNHLRDAWGFKGFVVSDCNAINDVNEGHHQTADFLHSAALALQAGTDLSCNLWTPGFTKLADAVRAGLVPESLVTQAVERVYTARFELGLFDPPGSSPLDRLRLVDIEGSNRKVALKAAEESIVLLKNNGILPLKNAGRIAVVGPEADQLISILGNYAGTPVDPVTPLDGMIWQFGKGKIVYAQGSTLAQGVNVPVPRSVFPAGLTTEFFATTDLTGRPVAWSTEPEVQADWESALPVPQLATHDYSVRWSGEIAVPAPGRYVFYIEPGYSFPFSPKETYRLLIDGKVLSEGSLHQSRDPSVPETPGEPPVEISPRVPRIPIDFTDSRPHEFRLEYSHSGDRAGGGVILKWEAPADVQLAEAVDRAKQADVVVAFVGLSPQLEGEEMPLKIDGFDGGDRTSLALPAAQLKLLDAVAATGKPVIVVLQSGSAVALSWARDHAAALLEAWYPGVEGGTAIARTLAGESNPAGRLPVTFYAGLEGLPAFTDYSMHNRTYRYFKGTPLWGFGYGLSYSRFRYQHLRLSNQTLQAGDPLSATVTVTNTSATAGDEVVEAYLKTPQQDGSIQSLVGFERVSLAPGTTRQVIVRIDPRSLSSVDEQGNRSILAGKYTLTVAGAQPQETVTKTTAEFIVTGTMRLPR